MNFTTQEYFQRLLNVKNKMSESGLDILILSDPSNMNYLTGYDGWSFYVPQGVIVSLDMDEPIGLVENRILMEHELQLF